MSLTQGGAEAIHLLVYTVRIDGNVRIADSTGRGEINGTRVEASEQVGAVPILVKLSRDRQTIP